MICGFQRRCCRPQPISMLTVWTCLYGNPDVSYSLCGNGRKRRPSGLHGDVRSVLIGLTLTCFSLHLSVMCVRPAGFTRYKFSCFHYLDSILGLWELFINSLIHWFKYVRSPSVWPSAHMYALKQGRPKLPWRPKQILIWWHSIAANNTD